MRGNDSGVVDNALLDLLSSGPRITRLFESPSGGSLSQQNEWADRRMNNLNLEALRNDAKARAARIDAQFDAEQLAEEAVLPVTLLAADPSSAGGASNSLDQKFFSRFVACDHLTADYAEQYKAALTG